MTRGRFAPSPTGRMHLGNVFCALLSWLSAKSKGGEWVLRIEDLDPQRSRREYALQLMDDLQWLGLPWDGEPVWQSQRSHIYEEYLHRLQEMGLTYPCYCTRADIMATQAPHETDGRVVYKGTCRPKSTDAARSVPTATSFNVQHSTFNAPFSPPETGGVPRSGEGVDSSFTPQTVHLRQGANEVFREMTECHFVPHEGSTIQCDAGPVRERSGGGGLTANHSPLNVHRPTLAPQTVPLRQGDERSGGGGLTAHHSPLTIPLATIRLIVPDCTIPFTDGHYGRHDINLAEHCGDYIIRRKDGAWAYQLAVVVDDALMGVTEIVRGRDLLLSSPQQIHLRNLLFQSTDDRVQSTENRVLCSEYRVQSTDDRVRMTDGLLKRKTITDAARSVPTSSGEDNSFNVQRSTFNAHPSPLTVNFFHHPLLCNAEGQRLCKRDKSMDLGYLRDKGTTPQEIIGLLAHLAGLTDTPAPITPQELIPLFSWDKVPTEDIITL